MSTGANLSVPTLSGTSNIAPCGESSKNLLRYRIMAQLQKNNAGATDCRIAHHASMNSCKGS